MKEQQKAIIENYIQSYNNFDLEGMFKDLSEHIIFENLDEDGQVDTRTEGLTAFKEQAKTAKQYFTKREQRVLSWEFEDKQVRIAVDYEAILAIDFPNGLKAGHRLELQGKSTFEFEKDKIILIRDES